MKIKKMNNHGVTLIELLGYTALIGMALALFSNIFFQMTKNYDDINGKGAVVNEANNIIRLIINSSNDFTPDYVRRCEDSNINCIEIINQVDIQINEHGVIEYKNIEDIRTLEIRDGNLYLFNLKLNNNDFRIYSDEEKNSEIRLTCSNDSLINYGICTQPIIELDFYLVRVNKKGEPVTEPVQFKNRITYH